ncbi:hypothetical protein [Chryseobacterium wanjuense]
MKKIITMSLLMSTTIAFANTEEPKLKKDQSKNEQKVLTPKKTLKQLDKNQKKVIIRKEGTISDTCAAILALYPILA